MPSTGHSIRGFLSCMARGIKFCALIPQGSWIVKQSVGKKACLIGQALEINYFHGKNYLEVTIRFKLTGK